MFRKWFAILVLTVSACGGNSGPASPSPPPNTTETFTGSNSLADTFPHVKHPFIVSRAGNYAVTLTSFMPLAAGITVYVAVYGMRVTQCDAAIANADARLNVTAIGGSISPGTYCVAVGHSQDATVDRETYMVTVSHP